MDMLIHQLAHRFPMEQLLGITVEQKIDSSYVDAEMICLSEKRTVGQTTWNSLMRVTGYEHSQLRKFRGQSHYSIGKIIAAGAHFQSHMPTKHNRIRTFVLCLGHRTANGFDRILKLDAARELRAEPKRHSGRCHSNDRELYARDFFYDERLDLREWMFRFGRCAGRLAVQNRVCS